MSGHWNSIEMRPMKPKLIEFEITITIYYYYYYYLIHKIF
jgi:hypothetical protein